MEAKLLMVQGTASHVGKSLIVAALCRLFRQDGRRVAPFKAQNMSLNSFVTPEGGEIGRAQAAQAEAAGVPPHVDMNPILLKPESDQRSQVVVRGRPWRTVPARDYFSLTPRLWPEVTAALQRLRRRFEVVVLEGAGGAAEINLAGVEIVNMRVARHFGAPVLLVGDIERGGVFASLLGTVELLEPEERRLVKALVINKFRGDPALLGSGPAVLEERTGVPVAGILPWIEDLGLAEEDTLGLPPPPAAADPGEPQPGLLDIAVIRLPHLSNFDDFDPLLEEGGVRLRYADTPQGLGEPDAVILPGCKTTIADLLWLRRRGLADAIRERHRRGAFLIGICGGYQMLGRWIADEDQVESPCPRAEGLGLLPVATAFRRAKRTRQVAGRVSGEAGRQAGGLLAGAGGVGFRGYEIHQGTCRLESGGPAGGRQTGGRPAGGGEPPLSPFFLSPPGREGPAQPEGCLDAEGRVLGTFVHGLFDDDRLRGLLLGNLARARGKPPPGGRGLEGAAPASGAGSWRRRRELEYDRVAGVLRRHLDLDRIYRIAGLER